MAFEGGPGYPSIGSATTYLFMLGPLHRTHDLIVMDQRGTGTSDPIRCPDLQQGIGTTWRPPPPAHAAWEWRPAFGTAAVGDDLAAILRGLGVHRVDVYGDSYGSYAAQSFTANHPHWCGRRCSTARTTTPSSRSSPRRPCRSATLGRRSAGRAGSCPRILGSMGAFDRSLAAHPLVGRSRDADGDVEHVHLTPAGFAQLVFDATYSYTFFRDLPGALTAYRHGYRAPMLRLAAEDVSFNAAGGNAAGYSVGDLEAVSCHDYPAGWNVAAAPEAPREPTTRSRGPHRGSTHPSRPRCG